MTATEAALEYASTHTDEIDRAAGEAISTDSSRSLEELAMLAFLAGCDYFRRQNARVTQTKHKPELIETQDMA